MSQSFINGAASGLGTGVALIVVFRLAWDRLERRAQAKRKAEWDEMVRNVWREKV